MSGEANQPASSEDNLGTGPRESCCFGPTFFLVHLRRFVRDRCPHPEESLPRVTIHLGGGAEVSLCHVICLSTQWVAVAAFDEGAEGSRMRTEVLPYETIRRIVIRPTSTGAGAGSYHAEHQPAVDEGTTAEQLLEAAHGSPGVPADGVTWLRNEDP